MQSIKLGDIEQQNYELFSEATAKYEQTCLNNYENRQRQLVAELQQKTKLLRKQIAFYKKETSQENVDKLIAQKRRDKEKIRQEQEAFWRQLNQNYKKLQDQQKKLSNQIKENEFDVKNLKKKIQEFEKMVEVKKKESSMGSEISTNFMTQSKDEYQSPYKYSVNTTTSEASMCQKSRNIREMPLFSKKYQIPDNEVSHGGSNQKWNLNKIKRAIYFNDKQNTGNLCTKKRHQRRKVDKQAQGDDQLLMIFLSNPRVKEKLYDILRRQL